MDTDGHGSNIWRNPEKCFTKKVGRCRLAEHLFLQRHPWFELHGYG
jgi:hypothetical protein